MLTAFIYEKKVIFFSCANLNGNINTYSQNITYIQKHSNETLLNV